MAQREDYKFTKRLTHCAVTGEALTDGQVVYTAIFPSSSDRGYLRKDYSEAGWSKEGKEEEPFSYWKHLWKNYEAPKEEPLPSLADSKSLFIHLTDEDDPATERVRFILALALERNRKLEQVGTQHLPQGLVRLYKFKREHRLYVVSDPNLPLSQITELQAEVHATLKDWFTG